MSGVSESSTQAVQYTYMVFIFMILTNVFLSFINDAFAEVSSDVQKQSNEHELLDYVIYVVKDYIGKLF